MMVVEAVEVGVADRFETLDVCLERWGRWAVGRTGPIRQRCRGIESRYRPESAKPEPSGSMVPVMPDHVGIEVERVVAMLPREQARLVRMHYVTRLPQDMICRRLALRFGAFRLHLKSAVTMVDNLLRRKGVALSERLVL